MCVFLQQCTHVQYVLYIMRSLLQIIILDPHRGLKEDMFGFVNWRQTGVEKERTCEQSTHRKALKETSE